MEKTERVIGRRLPSADRVGLGLAFLGFYLGRLLQNPVAQAIPWIVVLGLPLLRETGLIRDADERIRALVRRAGLHAFLVTGCLLVANRMLFKFAAHMPQLPEHSALYYSLPSLLSTLVCVYLVSYLLQYWGAHEGGFRILMGFAAILLVETMWALVYNTMMDASAYGLMAGLVVGLVLMAFGCRRWPRGVGGLLLCFVVLGMADFSVDMVQSIDMHVFWARLDSLVSAGVLVGGLGGYLILRGRRTK